jgi:hypothetical protein
MIRRCAPLWLLVVVLAILGTAARADDLELVPEMDLHIEFSRYAPTDRDFVWDSWLGGRATLLRVGPTSVFIVGDVETILGRELRTFDANQSNYVLEGGITRDHGPWSFSGAFHHVSRHLIDRPKSASVDWNMLGLRAERRLSAGTEQRGRVTLGVAREIGRTFVRYVWEFRAAADYDLLKADPGALYGRVTLRAITEEKTLENTRGGFLDALIEGGWRVRRTNRMFHLFLAYEHRNDVYLLTHESRDRALFGFRVGVGANPGW